MFLNLISHTARFDGGRCNVTRSMSIQDISAKTQGCYRTHAQEVLNDVYYLLKHFFSVIAKNLAGFTRFVFHIMMSQNL